MGSRRKLVIAGALGVVGRAVLEHFAEQPDGEVVGISRRSPDFASRASFVAADLRDPDAAKRALQPHADATHLVYAALYEKPELVRGWFSPEHVDVNTAMLRHTLDALGPERLEHVSLLQGTKAYGVHLGQPIRVPAREREPRHPHENFYFHQEDLLRERQQAAGFATTIFRPQVVFGLAVGSAMNPIAALGAYAALQKARGEPFRFGGHPHALAEATDARLLARAIAWAQDAPAARDRTFNVTNGDVVVWSELAATLAPELGLELVHEPGQRTRWAEEMPRHAALWDELVGRHGLRPLRLDELIGLSWQYADALWNLPEAPARPPLVSTIALRQAGFGDCIDSEDAALELIQEMVRRRYLPPFD